ncbi:MAG: polyketide synthase dehydratase domain-containing protein, partial [Blastocatellia bacterium]|nr:polyketide synthase dehydratase domain-containing protein [Blastocatellia bacterium]
EEYRNARIQQEARQAEPRVFTVSAKDGERLQEYIDRLLVQIRSERDLDLASLCYTLQVGREAMEERMALVVKNVDELIARLSEWSLKPSSSSTDIYRSSPGLRRGSRHFSKARQTNVGELSPSDLASRWAAGEDVDWESLYTGAKPERISLPTYPFARNRYWITDLPLPEKLSHSQLHPLISYNSSTLKDVSFSSSLTDTAFYAVDHQVHDQKVFPGAGFLEVACISGNIAGERRVRRIKDIVWIQPLVFRTGSPMIQTFLRDAGGDVEYSISSMGDDNEMIVHSEGRLSFSEDRMNAFDTHAAERIPIQDLKARCTRQEEAGDFYTKLSEFGLHYGPSFRTIQEIHANGVFALVRLKISDNLKGEFDQFILHPSIIDGALQTIAALAGNAESTTPHLPFALDELEIHRPLPQACYAYAEYADSHSRNGEGVRKFNLRILNESGDLLISFRNLYVRPLSEPLMRGGSNSADTVHRAEQKRGNAELALRTAVNGFQDRPIT